MKTRRLLPQAREFIGRHSTPMHTLSRPKRTVNGEGRDQLRGVSRSVPEPVPLTRRRIPNTLPSHAMEWNVTVTRDPSRLGQTGRNHSMKNKLLLAAILVAMVAILATLFAGTLISLIPPLVV